MPVVPTTVPVAIAAPVGAGRSFHVMPCSDHAWSTSSGWTANPTLGEFVLSSLPKRRSLADVMFDVPPMLKPRYVSREYPTAPRLSWSCVAPPKFVSEWLPSRT